MWRKTVPSLPSLFKLIYTYKAQLPARNLAATKILQTSVFPNLESRCLMLSERTSLCFPSETPISTEVPVSSFLQILSPPQFRVSARTAHPSRPAAFGRSNNYARLQITRSSRSASGNQKAHSPLSVSHLRVASDLHRAEILRSVHQEVEFRSSHPSQYAYPSSWVDAISQF
jgi:hypothetical protein